VIQSSKKDLESLGTVVTIYETRMLLQQFSFQLSSTRCL